MMWQEEGVYHLWDILREFLGHNFMCSLRTLKPKKNLKNQKPKNLKSFLKPVFFQPFAHRIVVKSFLCYKWCLKSQ